MTDRRLVAWTAAVLAVGAVAVVAVRERWLFPVGYALTGNWISNAGFAIQLAAMVAGIVALHLVRAPAVRAVLVAEGAVCLLAHGVAGLAFAAGVLAWWVVLNATWLGRARAIAALVLVAAMNACAWAGGEVAGAALVFSMMFTLRLLVLTYDRWQHDFERLPLLDYLTFMLPAPLVIVPPYVAVIPMFGGFSGKVRPALTPARLRAIARHGALAAAFGTLRGGAAAADLDLSGPVWACWKFGANVLDVAAIGHLLIALLLLHGIEERLPLFRPLLATRIVQFWQRFGVHQKDAQVFLFYTPALLRLRRANRYLAIVLATTWTLVVGNTLLHLAVRQCFLPDPLRALGWGLAANAIMGAALALDLCYEERWNRRGGTPPRTPLRLAIGWALTMAVAVTAGAL